MKEIIIGKNRVEEIVHFIAFCMSALILVLSRANTWHSTCSVWQVTQVGLVLGLLSLMKTMTHNKDQMLCDKIRARTFDKGKTIHIKTKNINKLHSSYHHHHHHHHHHDDHHHHHDHELGAKTESINKHQ